MRSVSTLVLFLVIGTYGYQLELPTFEWVDMSTLKIVYPNGNVDFAPLKSYNPIPVGPNERAEDVDLCIFNGYLTEEENVHITLAGCPFTNNFQVHFQSKHLRDNMFNVVEGKVDKVVPALGSKVLNRDGTITMNKDIAVEFPKQSQPSNIVPVSRGFNANGYRMSVKIRYDDNFKGKFGDDTINSVRRVMAFAQAQYMLKDTLTTTINLDIDPIVEYIPGKWVADKDLDLVAAFSKDPAFNAYVYLGYRNDEPGTLGIAYTSTTCGEDVTGRSSLNEYQGGDLNTGLTIAHEIGHNLGMKHDFNSNSTSDYIARFDSKGNPCSQIGGIMDYKAPFNKWSTCSVEDFVGYFSSLDSFCLNTNP